MDHEFAHSAPLNTGRFILKVDAALEFAGHDPAIAVTVKCARCPGWAQETTLRDRPQVWAAHQESKHG